jgi:PHD/YefM family antitoxin component YafN of YafNO toxin-antitoxin module
MGQADILDRFITITSFNEGHASEIFERARSMGPLFVLKNNAPEVVIVSPEDYVRMSEAEENYTLLLEATERLAANAGRPATPIADVMAEFGITDADLEALDEVELA